MFPLPVVGRRWVGGWVVETKAVGMSCCWILWVGGWLGGRAAGVYGWVGGWVTLPGSMRKEQGRRRVGERASGREAFLKEGLKGLQRRIL